MSGGTMLVFALLGLAIGMGLSYLFRRWRGPAQSRERGLPAVYASRQEARKIARQRSKKR